ncbi:reverse transcriptase family protein [Halodesulfovibrio aestuarii]|uniref:reverse transcriptase family protein n=1 Tax=Halodesulfovibrio aestuarii TaxID=126333 RepID=UPI0004240ABD
MNSRSTHQIYSQAKKKLGQEAATDLKRIAKKLQSNSLPVLFSLKHLSIITNIDFRYLRKIVNRRSYEANYSLFSIRKRSGGRRFIHAVTGELFYLQRYINKEILQKIEPHHSSYAFHSGKGIRDCAEVHCGAKWLFQFDLRDFFYSINEPSVYKIFRQAGYPKLLSFELARLCTTTHLPAAKRKYLNFSPTRWGSENDYPYPKDEHGQTLGVLPQGAPTSPALSNLVAKELDKYIEQYADEHNLSYTRYADDITLSAVELPSKMSAHKIRYDVNGLIYKAGFRANKKKTRIAGPGAKKLVLGLLVDGHTPRLSRETVKRLDRLLHAISKYRWKCVADNEGFDSVYGLENHLHGLLCHIKDVDYERWQKYYPKFVEQQKQLNKIGS